LVIERLHVVNLKLTQALGMKAGKEPHGILALASPERIFETKE
jgi:hypothetical protein